jgi:hypothetical protein
MTALIHVVIRIDPDGVYATSPQAPGLVFMRPGIQELRAELQDVLAFHFDTAGPFRVLEHHERHYDVAGGGEIVTRIAVDEHAGRRNDVYQRIGAALTIPEQVPGLLSIPPNVVGEHVFVCAVASDTLGWLFEQLDERGDAFAAAVSVADPFLFTIPLLYGEQARPSTRPTYRIGTRDYTWATTLGQVMKDTPVVSPLGAQIPA